MDKRQRNILTLLLIVTVAFSGVIFVLYNAEVSAPSAPDPEPVDTDGDGVIDAEVGFSLYQALHLRFTDGSDVWKYPKSRTSLSPLYVKDYDSGKTVQSLQSYVFFTLTTSKQASYVTFKASASVDICYVANKDVYRHIATMQIDEPVTNIQSKADTQVISSTMTASDFEALLSDINLVLGPVPFYYRVSLRNISANVVFADGSTTTFAASGVQAEENQLWWEFQRVAGLEIVGMSTEWSWT